MQHQLPDTTSKVRYANPEQSFLYFCQRGEFAKAAPLLQEVPVDLTDQDGNTALMWAVLHNNENFVEALLQQGANLYKINREGKTAIHLAILCGTKDVLQKFEACKDEAVFYAYCQLQKLTEAAGMVSVNMNLDRYVADTGDTPLILAIKHRNLALARACLKHGASATKVDKQYGSTPLSWAAFKERPEMVKLLHGHGVDFTQDEGAYLECVRYACLQGLTALYQVGGVNPQAVRSMPIADLQKLIGTKGGAKVGEKLDPALKKAIMRVLLRYRYRSADLAPTVLLASAPDYARTESATSLDGQVEDNPKYPLLRRRKVTP